MHFVKNCHLSTTSNVVSLLEEEDAEDELPVFKFFEHSTNQSTDSNLVTLQVPSGNFIPFKIDTGARCNRFCLCILIRSRPVILSSRILLQLSRPLYPTDGGNILISLERINSIQFNSFILPLTRMIYLSAVVLSGAEQVLSSYFGQISIRSNSCS